MKVYKVLFIVISIFTGILLGILFYLQLQEYNLYQKKKSGYDFLTKFALLPYPLEQQKLKNTLNDLCKNCKTFSEEELQYMVENTDSIIRYIQNEHQLYNKAKPELCFLQDLLENLIYLKFNQNESMVYFLKIKKMMSDPFAYEYLSKDFFTKLERFKDFENNSLLNSNNTYKDLIQEINHLLHEGLEGELLNSLLASFFLVVLILLAYTLFVSFVYIANKRDQESKEEIEFRIRSLESFMKIVSDFTNKLKDWNFSLEEDGNSNLSKENEKLYFLFRKGIIRLNIIFFYILKEFENFVKLLETSKSNLISTNEAFQEFSSSFEEMSASFEQVNAALEKNLESSEFQKNQILLQEQKIQKEIKEIQNVLESFASLNQILNQLFSQMGVFKENSKDVFRIVKVIQDITERTNLLALNASIEAARAGEQGKGFSVVAEEITKLAEKIKNSTKTIQEIMVGFQNTISNLEKEGGFISSKMNDFFKIFTEKQSNLSEVTQLLEKIANFVKEVQKDFTEQYATNKELQKANEKNSILVNQVSQKMGNLVSKTSLTFDFLLDSKSFFEQFTLIRHFLFQKYFSVEIQKIDYHHQNLFILFNKLLEILYSQNMEDWHQNYAELNKELYDYTVYHFSYEEELMKRYHYPEYENHKKAHEQFKEFLLSKKIRSLKELTDFCLFLFDWLIDHIYFIDRKYSEYFKNIGVFEEIQKLEDTVTRN